MAGGVKGRVYGDSFRMNGCETGDALTWHPPLWIRPAHHSSTLLIAPRYAWCVTQAVNFELFPLNHCHSRSLSKIGSSYLPLIHKSNAAF